MAGHPRDHLLLPSRLTLGSGETWSADPRPGKPPFGEGPISIAKSRSGGCPTETALEWKFRGGLVLVKSLAVA